MSDQGWIKLYRKIQTSFVWTNSDQLKLWLLILMKANHSQNKFLFNGQEVSVSSGQLVTGARALTFEFNQGVSVDNLMEQRKLWRWVKRFEKSGMLTIQSNARYSVITIVNWTAYQGNDNLVTSQRQSTDNLMTTNKNDKNEDNDKKKDKSKEPAVDYKKIVDYLNSETGHKYHTTDKTRGMIHARIAEGFTEHDFGMVIHYKSLEWKDNPDMQQYLRPKTLFSAEHFDDYTNEARAAASKQQRQNTSEPPVLTPEEGSARQADYMARLEKQYAKEGESNE